MNGEELHEHSQFLDSLNHRFKPRTVSFWTVLYGMLGLVGIVLYIVWVYGSRSGISLFAKIGDANISLLVLGLILTVASFASEAISRLRTCCPWRVKEQLKLALYTANLLPYNTEEWGNYLRIGRAKRKGRNLLTVRFELLHAKANQDAMSKIAQSSSFRHAQSCEIKPYVNKRGRIEGWILYVWFVPMTDYYELLFRGGR